MGDIVYAMGSAPGGGSMGYGSFLPLIIVLLLVIVFVYFCAVRPMQNKSKRLQELESKLENLQRGGKLSANAELCINCKSPLKPGIQFCPNCGNKVYLINSE